MDLRVADQIYLGSAEVDRVYQGATRLWPPESAWTPLALSPLAWWSFRRPENLTLSGLNVLGAADLSGNGRDLTSANVATSPVQHPQLVTGLLGLPFTWAATDRYRGFSCTAFNANYMAARVYKASAGSLNRHAISAIVDALNSSPYTAAARALSFDGAAPTTAGFLPRPDSIMEWYEGTARAMNRLGSLGSTGSAGFHWAEVILLDYVPSDPQRAQIRGWLQSNAP
jgi:hypothetical protein